MKKEFDRVRSLVESRLEKLFTGDVPEKTLAEAMRYSLLAGGKRIRPVLAIEMCIALGGCGENVLDAACAVELLHTYSLIHDDLPCMDNDDLRRGKPTNHKVYGECTAVLAGDALQTEAFRLMLGCGLPAERTVLMAKALADAAGLYGICGGQALDIDGEGRSLTGAEIEKIHSLKTAALLVACAKIGAYAAGADENELSAAVEYAENIGIAFQIRDDVLDVTSSPEELGKNPGSDDANEKSTFVTLYGIERCMELTEEKTDAAKRAAEKLPNPEFLIWLADYLAGRKN